MTFVFEMRANERPGLRLVRCCRQALADGPMSFETTPERLRAWVNLPTVPVGIIGGQPVNDIASWRTNCAVQARGAMGHCGRVMKPAKNAQPTLAYVECAVGDANWVPNDGTNVPEPGDLFYVGPSKRLPYDHVGIFGETTKAIEAHPAGVVDVEWETFEGGGGSGTHVAITTRQLHASDHYDRHILGWWKMDRLLPPSPDESVASDDRILGPADIAPKVAVIDLPSENLDAPGSSDPSEAA